MGLFSVHLGSCRLKPLWRNHAHLFALVAFTLGYCELKPLQRNHTHLFAPVAFELFVLNRAFHGTFPRCTFDFPIRRFTR